MLTPVTISAGETMLEIDFLLEFLNSGTDDPVPADYFADGESVGRWLQDRGFELSPAPTDEDARAFRRARAAIGAWLQYRCHGGEIEERTRTVIASLSERAPLLLQLDDDGALRLAPASRDMAGLLSELMAVLHRADVLGNLDRIKVCADPGCRWAFYDSSKNRSRVWCDMGTCGARSKVRAYRSRLKSS